MCAVDVLIPTCIYVLKMPQRCMTHSTREYLCYLLKPQTHLQISDSYPINSVTWWRPESNLTISDFIGLFFLYMFKLQIQLVPLKKKKINPEVFHIQTLS